MPSWNAGLYLQFGSERTQPSIDLTSRIAVEAPQKIIDLGCGPGNSTAILRQRWPESKIIGLDSSPDMIATAFESYPEETWLLDDVTTWTAEPPFDVVFSNAALQWVPGHEMLFPNLLEQVAPGGALAVQMPAGTDAPLHRVLQEVASDIQWSHLLGGARHSLTKESPSFYYDLLQPLASRLDIWETEYCHVMESQQAILNWYRGTGLRPYLAALENDDQREEFEARLLEGYTQAYPRQKDGRVLFPFRRLFLIAYR